MLTNNFYGVLINSYTGAIHSNLVNDNGAEFKPTELNWERIRFDSPNIYFGTGATPPMRDDYKLSGTQIEDLVQQTRVHSYETLSDGVKITKTLFINNSGTEAITVKEMAWIESVHYSNTGWYKILLDRTLLEEPVTIQPGGTAQINYSIFFKYGS